MNSEPEANPEESRGYPAMSHPTSDPAVTAVAARMAGLRSPHPANARILEIGCASGHNLLPLAARWPDADFTGIDLMETAIGEAAVRAAEAGISNARFITADLKNFTPPAAEYDCIIAHGVFSWVDNPTKQALLDFCRRHLSSSGIACVSFNVTAGWEPRLPVIDRVREISAAENIGLMDTLARLRDDPSAADIRPIVEDMLAKGPDILPFDDFAPINDPWPLERFVAAATGSGLRWLGESDPAENFPPALGDEARRTLMALDEEPVKIQTAVDLLTGRTFRSVLLCRDDAPVAERVSSAIVLEFALRRRPGAPADSPLARTLRQFAPSCVGVAELAGHLGGPDLPALAREISQGIASGDLVARIEPALFNPAAPEHPQLPPFRLLCARLHLPLVDVWHRPCAFPVGHYPLLEKMDGSRTLSQLAAISRADHPELDFQPWLDHLASRGMFA